ncbi:MAG: ferrous iron transport protein B [marine benthic group bacterium]|jgi:ferrous iron transport protein B|nr:ferrous iron transport protein B [Candidatus Benthicola marisminoris]
MSACETCPAYEQLTRMGISMGKYDRVVALAGNPNTGKSTLFNSLTGLRQHTGNWPGKTVTRAEGGFEFRDVRFKLVDLPGTYSLMAASQDEEVARDFLLFARPDCTVVVTDATALERNLNLALQVMEVTSRVVVCVNLIDEAERKGIRIDAEALSADLGVPVVLTSARSGRGVRELVETVHEVAEGRLVPTPHLADPPSTVAAALEQLAPLAAVAAPDAENPRWIGYRLLDGDHRVRQALSTGELAVELGDGAADDAEALVERADALRPTLGQDFRDATVEALYHRAEKAAGGAVRERGSSRLRDLDRKIDRVVTSPILGLPIMLGLLALVFWITVVGANVPSQMLAQLLFGVENWGAGIFASLGSPGWLTGFVWHGVFRGLAWVVSVMLPPMAIFFPMFTLLEDLGYLPRVAFNLDWLFRRAGAHGKQSLSMAMGFGCNAAGIISTRIIDSPRERLIAILTNNFVPCNGRFPTLIMLATVFVAASVPPAVASFAAAGTVVGVVLVGVFFTLLVSWALSRTVLKGQPTAFTLELPPYRRPGVLRVLYTSLIDRTMFVLWRAIVVAAPAGGVIWILGNIYAGDSSLAQITAGWLDPLGQAIGLDGVILLAYVIAIPANEIVVPTMLMVYAGLGMMTEPTSYDALRTLLVDEHGWTLVTAICLMLFSLLHNPCATTILTMWKETRSRKWTTLGALMPLGIAFAVTFVVATAMRAW